MEINFQLKFFNGLWFSSHPSLQMWPCTSCITVLLLTPSFLPLSHFRFLLASNGQAMASAFPKVSLCTWFAAWGQMRLRWAGVCWMSVSGQGKEGRKKCGCMGLEKLILDPVPSTGFTVKGYGMLRQLWTWQRTRHHNRGWGADLDSVFYLDSEFSGNGHLEVTEDINSCWNGLGWRKGGEKFLGEKKKILAMVSRQVQNANRFPGIFPNVTFF